MWSGESPAELMVGTELTGIDWSRELVPVGRWDDVRRERREHVCDRLWIPSGPEDAVYAARL